VFTHVCQGRVRTVELVPGANADAVPTLIAHERQQFREAGSDMHDSAMRTASSRHIEAKLHLMERLLELGSRHRPNLSQAFVAHDDGLASVCNSVQAAAAIRIPEVGMGQSGCYNPLVIHVLYSRMLLSSARGARNDLARTR
jgi:hypothetical protein